MGVFYLICWLRNYPQDRGTRPNAPYSTYVSAGLRYATDRSDVVLFVKRRTFLARLKTLCNQYLTARKVEGFVQGGKICADWITL